MAFGRQYVAGRTGVQQAWAGGYQANRARELARVNLQGVPLQSNFELVSGLQAAIAEAARWIPEQLRTIVAVFEHGIDPAERQAAHEYVGQRAQTAVLRSYAATVTRQKKVGAYRMRARKPGNVRFADGALRRALAAKDFYQATPNGIAIINTSRLDKEARHWARLNAGAGPRGGGSMRTFQVRFGGMTVAAIGIEMEGRPAFMLPAGYWWGGDTLVSPGGGPAEFYPTGEGPLSTRRGRRAAGGGRTMNRAGDHQRIAMQRRRMSRGIKARNFLDAGAAAVARDLGPAYDRMIQRMIEHGSIGGTTGVKVPTRMRTGMWRVRTFRGSHGGFSSQVPPARG